MFIDGKSAIKILLPNELGFHVGIAIGIDPDLNKCFLQIKELFSESNDTDSGKSSALLLKGISSIFLSSLLEGYIAMHRPFNNKKPSVSFRMSGIIGPDVTGTHIGVCSWREPGIEESYYYSNYVTVICYSKEQACCALRARLTDCRIGSSLLPKYLEKIDNWDMPDKNSIPSEIFDGEIAKLINCSSLVYHVRRIMQLQKRAK